MYCLILSFVMLHTSHRPHHELCHPWLGNGEDITLLFCRVDWNHIDVLACLSLLEKEDRTKVCSWFWSSPSYSPYLPLPPTLFISKFAEFLQGSWATKVQTACCITDFKHVWVFPGMFGKDWREVLSQWLQEISFFTNVLEETRVVFNKQCSAHLHQITKY